MKGLFNQTPTYFLSIPKLLHETLLPFEILYGGGRERGVGEENNYCLPNYKTFRVNDDNNT